MVDGGYDRVVPVMAGLTDCVMEMTFIHFQRRMCSCLPQGAAIQASIDRMDVIEILQSIHHIETARAITAEGPRQHSVWVSRKFRTFAQKLILSEDDSSLQRFKCVLRIQRVTRLDQLADVGARRKGT